ncbi:hypothetical protein ARMGADRAFT_1090216 [Armillaria gallica]|uniref:Uncharacterized protein n=1 Tax=Armillaria gallica TaxID=47427 RepID=A0A2H3CTL0_ARMGA|nr:hypothetical protein ARMGADRAFT_1090216 [Armillaria gallica]
MYRMRYLDDPIPSVTTTQSGNRTTILGCPESYLLLVKQPHSTWIWELGVSYSREVSSITNYLLFLPLTNSEQIEVYILPNRLNRARFLGNMMFFYCYANPFTIFSSCLSMM